MSPGLRDAGGEVGAKTRGAGHAMSRVCKPPGHARVSFPVFEVNHSRTKDLNFNILTLIEILNVTLDSCACSIRPLALPHS